MILEDEEWLTFRSRDKSPIRARLVTHMFNS
jgi:hypothetical protein